MATAGRTPETLVSTETHGQAKVLSSHLKHLATLTLVILRTRVRGVLRKSAESGSCTVAREPAGRAAREM